MGVTQLLPLIDKNMTECHISEFSGKIVAVDSYCWLHKAAIYTCEDIILHNRFDKFISNVMKYIYLLLANKIKPIMVFDGKPLPTKLKTEEKRKLQRTNALRQANELIKLGKTNEAFKYLKSSVDITPEIAYMIIKECRKLNIDCLVAPYEADAQLTYLSIHNIVDCIISEDSDLIAYGSKKVLYKMDNNGYGKLMNYDCLHNIFGNKPELFNNEKFLHMCILAGCDYVESLPGVGIKKAFKFITMTAENDPNIFLNKLPSYLNLKKINITDEYKNNFLLAKATYRHQIIFDVKQKKLTYLNSLDNGIKNEHLNNIGEFFNNNIAWKLSKGSIDPLTLNVFDLLPLHNSNPKSIWNPKYFSDSSSINCEYINETNNENNIINENYDKKCNEELQYYISNCKVEDNVEYQNNNTTVLRSDEIIDNVDFCRKILKQKDFNNDNNEVCTNFNELSNTKITSDKIKKFEYSDETIESVNETNNYKFFQNNTAVVSRFFNNNDKYMENSIITIENSPSIINETNNEEKYNDNPVNEIIPNNRIENNENHLFKDDSIKRNCFKEKSLKSSKVMPKKRSKGAPYKVNSRQMTLITMFKKYNN